MLKRDELANPQSCLNKAADEEPIFVLRAKDPVAAAVVRIWASLATMHESPRRWEAFCLSQKMDNWRECNLAEQELKK